MKRYTYILIACVLVMSSCKTTQQLTRMEQQQLLLTQKLDEMSHKMDSVQQQLTAVKRQLNELSQTQPEESTPTPLVTKRDWNTCVMRGAKAKVTLGSKSYSSSCSTPAVWDTLVVISITPAFGIEAFRVEATPRDITVINKAAKEYYRATYAELNTEVRPFVTFADLRSLASGKTPASAKNGVLTYTAKNGSASLQMTYTTPTFNQPLSITRLDVKKYTKKDFKTLLK